MIFTALSDGRFLGLREPTRCALGRRGGVAAAEKHEGDEMSPIGDWPIRRVLYRPDKGVPFTTLPTHPIANDDGWCDAPNDPAYNRPIRLPYPASAEKMWRDDDVYDLVVVLGHNDDPPVSGMGSAIFLHLAHAGYEPTEGCIALSRPDVEALLGRASPGDILRIARAE